VLNIQVGPGQSAGGGDDQGGDDEVIPALIAASHDAQVRVGPNANVNYGSDTRLGAMAATAVYEERESYVSFDIGSLAGNVTHAVVRLRMLTSAPSVANSAALVTDDWSESSITWNSKPASGATLATWSGQAGGLASINVTSQVNSLLAQGYTTLSLRIFPVAGSGMITYGSQEGDPANQPLLEVFAV
jgi:hypothetical protein